MTPEEILAAGRPHIDAILLPVGFAFKEGGSGRGSGGPYVTGSYVRGTRKLEFSVRWTLGLVRYVNGGRGLAHDEYVRAVTGGSRRGAYPGYHDAPADDFKDLATDIQEFGGAFLDESESGLAGLFDWHDKNPPPKGMAAL